LRSCPTTVNARREAVPLKWQNGTEHGGVKPKYRPRGYNEGPKDREGALRGDG
jgi:hypothetical protein